MRRRIADAVFRGSVYRRPEIGLCVPASLEPVVWTGRRHVAKRIWGKKKETPVNVLVDITKLFVFSDFSEITRLAHTLQGFYQGNNDLYKNEAAHRYYLLVSKSRQTPEEFNKVCNILSEYGTQQTYTPAAGEFMKEHYQVILKNHALQTLAEL